MCYDIMQIYILVGNDRKRRKTMDKNKILFSIIVPVYNTEKYIKKCLDSLMKAIDIDCEVIIFNHKVLSGDFLDTFIDASIENSFLKIILK